MILDPALAHVILSCCRCFTGEPLYTVSLAQRGQASVTLQPDSGQFNLLGAGVVKLTV